MTTPHDYPHTQLLIDGQWCDAADGKTMAVFNPATGAEIGRRRTPASPTWTARWPPRKKALKPGARCPRTNARR